MRLAENTGRKKVAKNRHLATIAQFCRAIIIVYYAIRQPHQTHTMLYTVQNIKAHN